MSNQQALHNLLGTQLGAAQSLLSYLHDAQWRLCCANHTLGAQDFIFPGTHHPLVAWTYSNQEVVFWVPGQMGAYLCTPSISTLSNLFFSSSEIMSGGAGFTVTKSWAPNV